MKKRRRKMAKKSKLIRLSLSIEEELAGTLDGMVKSAGYRNRSEFVRDMIREHAVADQWQQDAAEVLGTVTLVYNHHQRELCGKLTEIQHDAHVHILAATHVHLSHEVCAEMIMVEGQPDQVKKLYSELRKPRGILYAALSMSAKG